jgi:hypothetical protein
VDIEGPPKKGCIKSLDEALEIIHLSFADFDVMYSLVVTTYAPALMYLSLSLSL